MANVQCETHVLVSSIELKGLVSDITHLKNQVPKVLAEVFDKASKVESLEKALESKCKEMEQLTVECQHLTAKVEVWMVECEKEKEDKLVLRKKVAETRQHLAHQAEYCTAFGAAACTLLWRVSRSEDTVQTLLNGAKVEEFFTLTSQTLDSFMKSMIEEGKRKNIDEEENQFVLAMAGTITNVAAASCGREYLASTSAGKIVLDVFLQLLMQLGVGQCIKLKTLVLMALYNVTINCNGLKYIAEKNGVANLLCWLLQNESEADLRCQVLRLIQSLVVEPDTSNKLTADVKSLLCDGFLEYLMTDRNADVREVAMEIRDDLKALQCEI